MYIYRRIKINIKNLRTLTYICYTNEKIYKDFHKIKNDEHL